MEKKTNYGSRSSNVQRKPDGRRKHIIRGNLKKKVLKNKKYRRN